MEPKTIAVSKLTHGRLEELRDKLKEELQLPFTLGGTVFWVLAEYERMKAAEAKK